MSVSLRRQRRKIKIVEDMFTKRDTSHDVSFIKRPCRTYGGRRPLKKQRLTNLDQVGECAQNIPGTGQAVLNVYDGPLCAPFVDEEEAEEILPTIPESSNILEFVPIDVQKIKKEKIQETNPHQNSPSQLSSIEEDSSVTSRPDSEHRETVGIEAQDCSSQSEVAPPHRGRSNDSAGFVADSMSDTDVSEAAEETVSLTPDGVADESSRAPTGHKPATNNNIQSVIFPEELLHPKDRQPKVEPGFEVAAPPVKDRPGGASAQIEKPYACKVCGKRFSVKNYVGKHMKTHRDVKPHACMICHKTFRERGALIKHTKLHTGERPFVCDVCGRAFTQKVHLTSHRKCHTGERPHKCPICLRTFIELHYLRKHEKTHNTELIFDCTFCEKKFSTKSSLNAHVAYHTKKRKYKCDLCDKVYSQLGNLQIHKRHHTGERPYVCAACGKGCISSTELKCHTRQHTGERPYECDLCTKTFRSSSHLRNHKRMHTGEKPFVCDLCDRGFARRASMNIHRLSHTSIKPYACELCGKAYTRKAELKVHKRQHTGERPFECTLCGSRFVRKKYLSLHEKSHTGEKPYGCDVCDKAFTRKNKLKMHMKQHENEEDGNVSNEQNRAEPKDGADGSQSAVEVPDSPVIPSGGDSDNDDTVGDDESPSRDVTDSNDDVESPSRNVPDSNDDVESPSRNVPDSLAKGDVKLSNNNDVVEGNESPSLNVSDSLAADDDVNGGSRSSTKCV